MILYFIYSSISKPSFIIFLKKFFKEILKFIRKLIYLIKLLYSGQVISLKLKCKVLFYFNFEKVDSLLSFNMSNNLNSTNQLQIHGQTFWLFLVPNIMESHKKIKSISLKNSRFLTIQSQLILSNHIDLW